MSEPRHGVITYDDHDEWLIEDGSEGAAQIVARQVPRWFGRLVVAALVRTPETLDVERPTTERAAIAADRTWASGYSAGRAAASRAVADPAGIDAAQKFIESITVFVPVDAELVNATLVELQESPLPGARYAYEVVKRRFAAALRTPKPEGDR